MNTEIERKDACTWTQDSDGGWRTSCGRRWEFVDGGPEENGVRFCHGCGGRVSSTAEAEN